MNTLDAPRCWTCAYALRHTHHDDGRVNARHYREVPMQYAEMVQRQEEARQRLHDHLNGARPEVSDEETETEDGEE